jgi:hypothetical protein
MARESQIQIHRTEAVGATPSGLTSGELAVNLRDQRLFVGLSSGGYLTFNSVFYTPQFTVNAGNGINVQADSNGPTATLFEVSLNPDITGHTLNITGNAIFSGYDSGVTFNGRVSIGNGNAGWGLYRNPDAYNLTPSSGVAGLVDFTKTIASSIDYANRVGGKVAELLPANAYQEGNTSVRTVLDIDSITGAGMFLAKAYSSTGQGNLIGQYLGNLGGVPPLCYKNAPGDTPQTAVCTGLERALLVENINVNFQALGLVDTQIGTPFRTLIQYGTWIDNVQSPSGLGGVPAASGSYETTFDKYVRTGYILRGGTGTSGGATGTYIWSQWKNLVETTDDLGKYGVSTVNGATGDISITGAGNNAAVVVRSSVAGINRIDARIATNTGITGVASFSSVSFNVGATGVVTLKNPSTFFGVQGNIGGKADVTLGGNLTLTGSGSIRTVATQDFNGDGVDVVFDTRIATTSLTGVASFHPGHFTVTDGKVVASFSGGVTFSGVSVFSSGLSASGLATFSNGLTSLGGIHTTGLTATTAVFNGLATFNSGLTTTGLARFNNGLTALGGIHTIGLTATTAVFNGLATFSSGLSASGLATFSSGLTTTGLATFINGLTALGGIHTRGLTATNGRFTGNLTVDGNTTNTGTQTFNGGIQTTGLTSTGGLSASGLVWFTNGLTSLGGIHTTGLTATTAVFNGLATFNSGLTTTGLARFNNGLTALGGISTNGLTANIINVSDYIISTNGIVIGKEIQNVSIFPSPSAPNATGLVISGDIQQVAALAANPGTTFAGNVFAPTIKASNIVNQIAFGNATLTGNVSLTSGSNVTMTVVGNQVTIASSSSVGGGVTGIAFGANNTTAIVGQVSITAGSNVTLTRSGNQITIASSGTIANTGVTGIGFGLDAGLTGKINLTGSAITVLGNTITFTSGSGGVPSVNGNTSAITITGEGNNAAVSVRSAVAGTHLIDARIATTGVTGVASFDSSSFAVSITGHTTIKSSGISNTQLANSSITVNSGSGISVSGTPSLGSSITVNNTGVTGIAFGNNNTTAIVGQVSLTAGSGVTLTRGGVGNNVITIGANASVGATGDTVWGDSSVLVGAGSTSGAIWTGGYIAATNNKKLTARLTSSVRVSTAGIPEGMPGYVASGQQGNYEESWEHGLTGVGYFDNAFFTVDPKYGLVRLRGSFFAAPGSGLSAGVSGDDVATSLFFDPANLTAYTGTYTSKKTNFVLIYDGDETGSVKAKRASIQNFFAENFGLITSSTLGQLTNATKKTFDDNLSLEIGVVLGNVAAGQEGLVKGASAYAYIETNTVRSFNGLTGAVTAVASLNGCTAAVVITGSASEIEVLNTCPNIVIGLRDNVTISNLNVLSGATFGGNFSGATGSFSRLLTASAGISASTITTDYLVVAAGSTFGAAVDHTFGLSNRGLKINAGKGNSEILSYGNDTLDVSAIGGNGILNLFGAVVTVGDDGNNDGTQIIVDDTTQTITHSATQGHVFNGIGSFSELLTASAGLSASGATFANDIKVNGVNIGLGAGNVASNLGIGKGALSGNSGGLFNTAVGSGAMEIGTNSYSVAFGFNALHSCTGGGINNVALGSNAITTISTASNNVAIGSNSSQSLVDGSYNVSIGGESLLSNANGSSNLAIGYQALSTNFTSNNIGIGYQALFTNDEGQQNTAIGNEALKSIATTGSAERNTAIGYQAGRWKGATGTSVITNKLNTANDSIFIGWRARSSADAQTNQIVIGNNTVGGGSNTITIGTTGTIDATIYGKLHGTNGVSGPTASFNSLTVSQNTTLGSTASNTTTIYGAKIVNESIYSNGTLRNVGINFANGQVQTLTGIGTGATGTTAIYFMGAPATGAGNVTLLVTNGGSMTGNTTTWEGRIKWPGGVKPTLSTTGIDVISFITPDAGTTIYGFVGGLNFL